MKKTIEIENSLAKKARVQAAKEGISFKKWIETKLEKLLKSTLK